MLAREKAAIESHGTVDILVDDVCPQGIFSLLDLTMSRKLSKAHFENGFERLKGQLDIQNLTDLRDQPPKSQ